MIHYADISNSFQVIYDEPIQQTWPPVSLMISFFGDDRFSYSSLLSFKLAVPLPKRMTELKVSQNYSPVPSSVSSSLWLSTFVLNFLFTFDYLAAISSSDAELSDLSNIGSRTDNERRGSNTCDVCQISTDACRIDVVGVLYRTGFNCGGSQWGG